MIVSILSTLLALIFTVLAGFHVYWASGGEWGVEQASPSKEGAEGNVKIPKFAAFIVALILGSFALLYLLKAGFISLPIPERVITYASWIIPSLFLIRAVGEFKYVGFFKKIKNTEFGKMDTKLFSPLCLAIGLAGMFIWLESFY